MIEKDATIAPSADGKEQKKPLGGSDEEPSIGWVEAAASSMRGVGNTSAKEQMLYEDGQSLDDKIPDKTVNIWNEG